VEERESIRLEEASMVFSIQNRQIKNSKKHYTEETSEGLATKIESYRDARFLIVSTSDANPGWATDCI
jgi:hypothetical protein